MIPSHSVEYRHTSLAFLKYCYNPRGPRAPPAPNNHKRANAKSCPLASLPPRAPSTATHSSDWQWAAAPTFKNYGGSQSFSGQKTTKCREEKSMHPMNDMIQGLNKHRCAPLRRTDRRTDGRTEEEERNGRATATGGWTRRMPIVLGPTYADEGRRPVRAHRLRVRVRSVDITGCPLDYSRQKLSATKIYNGIGMSNICLVPL